MSAIPESLEALRVPVDNLNHYGKNPRSGDVSAIAESLKVNGQYRPVVVNSRTNEVLAGNHTLKAARMLGWSEIAATFVDADEDQAARIVLVDNRSNDLATYDDRALADLLESLDGDLSGTGFSNGDLAEMLAGLTDDPAELTGRDEAPQLPEESISKLGDVWRLGPHVVLCGDSTDAASVLLMLDGVAPDCVWTDPPYGVSYVGKTQDALTIQNDKATDLSALLAGAFATVVAVCRKGAPVYVAHADTERIAFETAMLEAGLLVRQNLIWVKNTIVLGHSDYHYKHEPILEAETPDDHSPLLYGFTPAGEGRLGRGGPRWYGDNKQSTVIDVPKPPRNADHPTMKPVELIQKMLSNSLQPGGLVLDLFGGSGSTLIAAHHEKSRAALVELDPRYVDVICRRYQEHTGTMPILESTGEPQDFTSGN